MLQVPFYDPTKSYDENYISGPYGQFANGHIYEQKGKSSFEFLGETVNLPFGIPAGPILNSNFAKAAFEKGFDLVVYKTIRSSIFPCHPHPNILPIELKGDLTLEKAKKQLKTKKQYSEPLSITNSFGVPSKEALIWQEDVKKAIAYAGRGQILILSFMGTVRPNQTGQEFIDDFALAAKQSIETGAKILEVNLSCPNIGNEGLVCYNLDVTKKVLQAIRKVIGNTPLAIKIGYYEKDADLEKLAAIANEYADDVSGINTIPAEVVNEKGEQALPGPNRLKSGVCGHAIKWAGIDTVKRLRAIKDKKNYSFSITGVGGVTVAQDYFDYIKAGADSVMSATGAMWNPLLAVEIKDQIAKSKTR